MSRANPGAALYASPARLHALDNLRALVMWLGIVLHVAAIHMVMDSPLPWRDERRTAAADALVAFIHAFRMPVFFILAGFFVALLGQRQGARAMMKHRLRRLALPFAVFWPLLSLATGVAGLLFLHRMATGRWGLDPALVPPGRPYPNTLHLWFLWLLLWFSVATGLSWNAGPRLQSACGRALRHLGGSAWGFAVLALPLVAAGLRYPNGLLLPSGALLPPWNEWLHNGMFYVFGLALYAHRETLFATYRRHWVAFACAGSAFFLAAGALVAAASPGAAIAFAYGSASWLWSFACIGAALRLLGTRHPVLGWLAGSAYWVYLVHLPLTVAFGALLFGVPLPALVKIVLNIGATTLVCLASYRWCVRGTWMGVLLNGWRR